MRSYDLYEADLFSKFGFEDGDLFEDLILEYRLHPYKWKFKGKICSVDDALVEEIEFEHCLLMAVVEKYLIPCCFYYVQPYHVKTIHNPIRAKIILPSIKEHKADAWVRVTEDQVIKAANEMIFYN